MTAQTSPDPLPPGPDRPVFIGGTGRSGTTVLGRLLGAHRELALTFPMELTFFSDRGGLADTYWWSQPVGPALSRRELGHRRRRLQNRVRDGERWVGSPQYFAHQLTHHWYTRKGPAGEPRGLHRSVPLDVVQAAAAEYLDGFRSDPLAASRLVASRLVDPMADAQGARRWVDTTPENTLMALRLHGVFPDLSVIHVMRDGRDTAASVVTQAWGPDDMYAALAWWRKRMVRSHRAMAALPPERVLVIQLEDLVTRDREGTLDRLLDFLGLPDDPGMRAWFDENVTPSRGHVGRWRRDVPAEEQERIDQRYLEVLAELDAREVPHPQVVA